MPTKQDGIRSREIGARIQTARREAGGMTQRQLADILGVTERSIAAYEAGDVTPYRFLRKLEDALGRPAAWFLYGDRATTTATDKQDLILERLEEIIRILKKR